MVERIPKENPVFPGRVSVASWNRRGNEKRAAGNEGKDGRGVKAAAAAAASPERSSIIRSETIE